MSEWNKNNRACKTTWSTLYVLNQHDEPFLTAGALTMKQLTFFTQAGDGELRKVAAKNLALSMDKIFRNIRHAKYEKGVKPETAVQDMVDILLNEKKTVADLAAVNDKNYLFLGESHDDI